MSYIKENLNFKDETNNLIKLINQENKKYLIKS